MGEKYATASLCPAERSRCIMTITMRKKNDLAYEVMFDDLIQAVFGFSFKPWLDLKLWNNNYQSYSIVEDSKMLANICIYKTEMRIAGEKVDAIQFGAVATCKEARGKGLSRLLMEHILSIYPNTPAFLFANPDVVDFYPKFGFSQVQIYRVDIAASINNSTVAADKRKFNDEMVTHALQNRSAYSNVLDCINTWPIQMFHLIMMYNDCIYHLPKCSAIVIAKQEESKLFLVDVIAQNKIDFDTILKELPFEGITTVEFGFCPDWLGITPTFTPVNETDSPLFIRGNWKLPETFRFPITSET